MKHLKQFSTFVIFASLIFSLTAMEERSRKDYSVVFEGSKYSARLKFQTDPDTAFSIGWSLEKVHDTISVDINGFNDKKSKKAIACAIQHIYLQLANNKFDVRYLEKVLLGKHGRSYQPIPEHDTYIKSTLHINEGFSKQITIPLTLHHFNENDSIILECLSTILPKLLPEDRQKYRDELYNFAWNIMSPSINLATGVRSINWPSAKVTIEKFQNKAAMAHNPNKRKRLT